MFKEYDISLVVPFIDPELPVLDQARSAFSREGITLLTSAPEVVEVGMDKFKTTRFFEDHGIPTPLTFSGESLNEELLKSLQFPVVVKPRFGSSSIGVHVCYDEHELKFYVECVTDPIIQSFAEGSEITIDVLCDFNGTCLSIVPRKRLKVRGGEVERAITVDDEELIHYIQRIVDSLHPVGPINVQCFKSEKGVLFTEINARFGGGYPLSYAAGADFPALIIRMVNGEKVEPAIGDYQKGLAMLRYDEAIYTEEDHLIEG